MLNCQLIIWAANFITHSLNHCLFIHDGGMLEPAKTIMLRKNIIWNIQYYSYKFCCQIIQSVFNHCKIKMYKFSRASICLNMALEMKNKCWGRYPADYDGDDGNQKKKRKVP